MFAVASALSSAAGSRASIHSNSGRRFASCSNTPSGIHAATTIRGLLIRSFLRLDKFYAASTIRGIARNGETQSMSFAVHAQTHPAISGLDATVYVLEDGAAAVPRSGRRLVSTAIRWQAHAGQAARVCSTVTRTCSPTAGRHAQRHPGAVPLPQPHPRRPLRLGRQAYQLPTERPARRRTPSTASPAAGPGASWITEPTRRAPG